MLSEKDRQPSFEAMNSAGRTRNAPDLGQAVLRTKEPQDLLVTERSSLLLRDDTGSIVATELVAARSARPGANVLGGGIKLDGLEAGRVVRADGASAAGGRQCRISFGPSAPRVGRKLT